MQGRPEGVENRSSVFDHKMAMTFANVAIAAPVAFYPLDVASQYAVTSTKTGLPTSTKIGALPKGPVQRMALGLYAAYQAFPASYKNSMKASATKTSLRHASDKAAAEKVAAHHDAPAGVSESVAVHHDVPASASESEERIISAALLEKVGIQEEKALGIQEEKALSHSHEESQEITSQDAVIQEVRVSNSETRRIESKAGGKKSNAAVSLATAAGFGVIEAAFTNKFAIQSLHAKEKARLSSQGIEYKAPDWGRGIKGWFNITRTAFVPRVFCNTANLAAFAATAHLSGALVNAGYTPSQAKWMAIGTVGCTFGLASNTGWIVFVNQALSGKSLLGTLNSITKQPGWWSRGAGVAVAYTAYANWMLPILDSYMRDDVVPAELSIAAQVGEQFGRGVVVRQYNDRVVGEGMNHAAATMVLPIVRGAMTQRHINERVGAGINAGVARVGTSVHSFFFTRPVEEPPQNEAERRREQLCQLNLPFQ